MAGSTISHYKIVSKLGEGGMGVVYKAEEETIGKVPGYGLNPRNPHSTHSGTLRQVNLDRFV